MNYHYAPIAQLDRVPDYESGGRGFESSSVRHVFRLYVIEDLKQVHFLFKKLLKKYKV